MGKKQPEVSERSRAVDCQNKKCHNYDYCDRCINRSKIAHEGYDLIQTIESCGCSPALTKAVNDAQNFVMLAEKEVAAARKERDRRKFCLSCGAVY